MKMNRKTLGWISAAALVLGAGLAVAKGAAAVTTPYASVKWTNLMGDGGPSMGVLWGDPMKGGESGFLLKLPAGFVSPAHSHSADYWAVTVTGKMSHVIEGQPEKDVVSLPQGSFIMIPAKAKHVSRCAPGAECLVAIRMHDKFDFVPVEAPKKETAKK